MSSPVPVPPIDSYCGPDTSGRPHTSRFIGVSWDKDRQKWQAGIGVNGEYRRLGRFDDEIEAAQAYDRVAREVLGEFARLNLPTAAEKARETAFVDRREARRMFGISLPQWKRWEHAGLVRGTKTSYRVFYKVEELEQLLAEIGTIEPPYPDPDRPGCYRVRLIGRGPFRRRCEEAIIDADSLSLVQGRQLHWSGAEEPGINATGYVNICTSEGPVALHRLIMGVTDEGLQIGHANGDPLDCRRENLVVRTIQERLWSARKRSTCGDGRPCTSRYKGVSWREDEQIWRSRITIDGKQRFLGRFHTEVEAAEAYDEAAREFFGEHAWLNFPQEGERGFVEATLSRAAA